MWKAVSQKRVQEKDHRLPHMLAKEFPFDLSYDEKHWKLLKKVKRLAKHLKLSR